MKIQKNNSTPSHSKIALVNISGCRNISLPASRCIIYHSLHTENIIYMAKAVKTQSEMNYAGGDEVIKTPSTPQRQKAFKLSMRLIIL